MIEEFRELLKTLNYRKKAIILGVRPVGLVSAFKLLNREEKNKGWRCFLVDC